MKIRAILLLVLGVTLFGVMDGLGKFLAGNYSVFQVVWARYAFAVPIALAMAGGSTWRNLVGNGSPWLQVGRALLPLLASATVILGLALMPLADFTAISFASPLLVAALSRPLLGEKISVHTWAGVVCGFVGVLMIVRPGSGTIAWAAVFPLGTALFFALYQVLTRLVSRGGDPAVTLIWTIAVGLVITTPMLPIGWRPVAGPDWLLLILSGLLFGMGQHLLIRAFSIAPAAILTPFTYAQIVAAIVFGALVFGDLPDFWTIMGTALVIGAGTYVLRHQAE
jgi:drug/metabolite transporter (DMT)-like permease